MCVNYHVEQITIEMYHEKNRCDVSPWQHLNRLGQRKFNISSEILLKVLKERLILGVNIMSFYF